MKIEKAICLILVATIFLPILSFAQIDSESIKQKAPGILEGWWNSIKIFISEKAKNIFFSALNKTWQATIKIWKGMLNWFLHIWNDYIWPKLEWLWGKILNFFRIKK